MKKTDCIKLLQLIGRRSYKSAVAYLRQHLVRLQSFNGCTLDVSKGNGKFWRIRGKLRVGPINVFKPSWQHAIVNAIDFLECIAVKAPIPFIPYNIFAKGNSKLPFYSFSASPIISCPGAGACLDFCYSLKAWRYPAGFFRQLQNLVLLWERPELIKSAFMALPKNRVVRLYVDGDFDSKQTMEFWFNLLEKRKDIMAYGYSKSWALFLSYSANNSFPKNYTLNLSSGSKYNGRYIRSMAKLPISRGEFVAVSIGKTKSRSEYIAAVKTNAGDRCFVCPGKCGDCLPNGEHACGSDRFRGVKIAIGIH